MIKNIIKNNGPIILIVLTSLLIGLFIFNMKPQEKTYTMKTDMFIEVDTNGALKLFDKGNFLLLLCRQNCEGCSIQGPYLQIALAMYGFDVYYLDVDKWDLSTEEGKLLQDKLDLEIEFDNKKQSFGKYIGYTPMIAIINDGKQVYGHIGSLTDEELGLLVKEYNIVYEAS